MLPCYILWPMLAGHVVVCFFVVVFLDELQISSLLRSCCFPKPKSSLADPGQVG